MNKHYKYDVAISFAEEDRDAALALEQAFRTKDIVVYYYPNKRADTLGNLKEKLTNIYSHEAKYAVVLLSQHYVNPDKEYVQVELAAIQSRMKEEPEVIYMVPVKLKKDDGENDPMKHKIFLGQTFLEWNHEPEKIVSLIWDMLGRKILKEDQADKHEIGPTYHWINNNDINNKASNDNVINVNNNNKSH